MRLSVALLTLSCMVFVPVHAQNDPKAIELLNRVDSLYQQDSAHAIMTMKIVTAHYERTLKLESWSLGLEYSLVRVLEPRKERGIGTLKRENEMWNYLPKVNRVVKVPPSMMMNSWMGSDFTNDDVMRETSWVDEYSVSMNETPSHYVLDLDPKEDTVTVWGGMRITLRKDNLLPVSQEYFSEDGTLMRTMEFSDITDFDGVTLPATMTLTPQNEPGYTQVTYQQLEFNLDLDASFFTLQNLRRGP